MKKQSKIADFFKIEKDDKAGFYLTIIFHLVLINILLIYSINLTASKETSFVLDFTKYEELEKEKKQLELKESVSEELDQLIAAARKSQPRNVAVDASSKKLKDDRHSNPNEVYDQARELQKKLDASKKEYLEEQDSPDDVALNKKEEKKKNDKSETYSGPSVVSYSLDGRKATHLDTPAYKCIDGGDVSVSIIVNRKGYVVGTKIIEEVSSNDRCLREYALKAAGKSRFKAVDNNAPERQVGSIVYRFVAQ